ncbi:alanine racemase [Paradesulfitobacterium aromaticivorans]
MERFRPVWAEVDLGALKRNYARIQSYTQSELMPIVKADAYGHGAIPVVRALKELGAKRFGVALLEEALEIKQEFPDLELMVIGASPEEHSDTIVRENIIPGIFRLSQAQALSKAGVEQGKTARLHVKVDTGMGRIGVRPDEWKEILKIAELPNVMVEGVYTHFATADHADLTFARKQLEFFQQVIDKLERKGLQIPFKHAANSAAILHFPEAHFNLVRPGIILYGLPPSQHVGKDSGLEPVMSWKARVTHVKTIEAGETVSYGRTFRAAYQTRVATIPVGYADGLRRALSNCGEALVRGERSTIIGRVCMDQTMLEVTKIPGVEVGDVVTLLGQDGQEQIDATEMAEWLNTINYEIVCDLSKRVPREYVE